MNFDLLFSRKVLSLTMADIRKITNAAERAAVWIYKVRDGRYEFHGPHNFYWYGRADNAYDARTKGWEAYRAARNSSRQT